MLNTSNQLHLDHLGQAIDWSRLRLQAFREHRMHVLRTLVGAHYSWSGSPVRIPINLLNLFVQIVRRQLVAKSPRAMVTTRDPQLKPVAADIQAWLDKAAAGMRLEDSLRMVVTDALLSIGIMKVGEAHAGEVMIGDTLQPYGQPFADAVDLDDLVFDITAKRWSQVQYVGNRYRVPLDTAKGNPLFDPLERNKLTGQTNYMYNERGDPRVTTLSQSNYQYFDEYEPHTELWDIWLPREQLVLVMPYQESVVGGFAGHKPLQVIRWSGPRHGPYLRLSYNDVPNNVMPSAPIQQLIDLAEILNSGWRKVTRQIDRRKKVVTFMGTGTDDAERFNRAGDGDAVRVDFPDQLKEVEVGGVSQEALIALEQARHIFNELAGNLNLIGGLAPESPTLGQDRMLEGNASAQVAEMQDRTTSFVQMVEESLAYFWWKNPVLTYEATRKVGDIPIPVTLTPQMRQIPWDRLSFEIDPYSLRRKTPEGQLQSLMQAFTQLVAPFMQPIMQQGGQIDFKTLLDIVSKYGGSTELADVLKWGPPPDQQEPMQMMQQAESRMPPPPQNGQQVRVTRPQMTDRGHSQVMQQLLAGGGQPKQAAMLGRQ